MNPSTQSFDFTNRTVFVAGGTSGINLGIADAFARAGARLAVMSRSPERVDEARRQLQAHGGEVLGFAADVRDYEKTAAALKDAHAQLGEFDVLVSGAAGNFPAPALGMSANGFKAVVDIDLLGTFNVLRAAHAYLRKPGAAIVNVSAPQAEVAIPLQAHVCAAKAGVDMLTRVLAIEWSGDGIRVNSVIPGPIEGTEGVARLAPSAEARERVARAVPLKRLGRKEDVANLVLFLCSPLASYITAAVVPVDGGWTTHGAAMRDLAATTSISNQA
ncbi:MAG: SDR family oxidoreductase [Pseudolabrys sp.]|jgi:NAD(P)-dependent dehydrogenase (short-subunit alcohol dehydrogenase family)